MKYQIAALFVDAKGIYPRIADDWWCEEKDARLYAGPLPVVAHPPCARWVNYAALNFKRYGGEHNRPGNDGGCFAAALAKIRDFGGVLEHPAFSHAWDAFGLAKPSGVGWAVAVDGLGLARNEYVCEVWQSAYGHRARKRTWLYCVSWSAPPELRWQRAAGTHQIGWFDRVKPVLSKRESSATTPEFAHALCRIADKSR